MSTEQMLINNFTRTKQSTRIVEIIQKSSSSSSSSEGIKAAVRKWIKGNNRQQRPQRALITATTTTATTMQTKAMSVLLLISILLSHAPNATQARASSKHNNNNNNNNNNNDDRGSGSSSSLVSVTEPKLEEEAMTSSSNTTDPRSSMEISMNMIQNNYIVMHNVADDVDNDHSRSLKRAILNNSSIVCNDGSRAGYYLRKQPNSKKWIVFLEGGWHCYDNHSCRARWMRLRHLMTSTQWPDTREVGGILSPHASENPYWHSANHVLVPYCSSDSWSGTRTEPVLRDRTWFMGALILRQVIADLIPLGLGRVPGGELLLVGSSAGGLGVMLNLDRIRDFLVNERKLQVTVRGVSDSGWFLDREPYTPSAVASTDSVRQGWKLWKGLLPEDCIKAHPMEPWRCYFGYRLYPTLKTPLFIFQWLFDEAQMRADNVGAPVTPQQWNYIHEMGGALRTSLDNVSAVFAPSCIGHAVLSKRDWVNIKIDDISLPSALRCWEHSTRHRRHDKIKRSTEATTVQHEQHSNSQRHQKHRQRINDHKQNNVAQRKHNHLSKEQREERKQRRQEQRQRRKQRRRKQQQKQQKQKQQRNQQNDIESKQQHHRHSNSKKDLTPEQLRHRQEQRKRRRKVQQQQQQHHKHSEVDVQHEQPASAAAVSSSSNESQKKRASNTAATRRNRVPRVPEKCGLRLLERCSWPQCNHSCPTLTNPLTGEEMRFLELLTSFGLDIEAVAAALGVDMHTLNNMERTELVNLLTQQVS